MFPAIEDFDGEKRVGKCGEHVSCIEMDPMFGATYNGDSTDLLLALSLHFLSGALHFLFVPLLPGAYLPSE